MVLIVKLSETIFRVEFENWAKTHDMMAIPHKNFAENEEIPSYAQEVAKSYSIETRNIQDATKLINTLKYISAVYDDGTSQLAK
jgi:hypothetical protein